jgi:hypothetical protein
LKQYYLHDKEGEEKLSQLFFGDTDINCTYSRWYKFATESSYIAEGKKYIILFSKTIFYLFLFFTRCSRSQKRITIAGRSLGSN